MQHCKSTMCVYQSLSRVRLFATPKTVACQASLSGEFSRQEYWRGLPFPSPGDVLNPGTEPCLLYCGKILYCLSQSLRVEVSRSFNEPLKP